MTKWTEHIKAFASKNGLSYKDAMKHPECKAEYQSNKSGSGVPMGIVAGDIDLARKSRGRPRKQTSKDKEDERLAMRVHNLEQDHKKMGMGKTTGHLEEVMDIAGNWVLPSALDRANAQLPMEGPSLVSRKHIIKNADEIMTKAENVVDGLIHTPKIGKMRGGKKMGGSLQALVRKVPKHIALGDERHHSEARDNLGLGANAGRHFISL